MLSNESEARLIGYGGMLMEAFVAMMALVAACVLQPGVYFAMNSAAGVIGTTAEQAAQTITQWGFVITPDQLTQTAKDIGETSILSRAGGAPTLAVGMAQILHGLMPSGMAFWYHYAILFEALFILTTIDAGTRVGRFMIQELLGLVAPALKQTESWTANLVATALCVTGWGYFLYQGVVDPLGGINTLWPLFGIANQMLAAIALTFATVTLIKMKRERYIWVTLLPTAWLVICTVTAGLQKIFSEKPGIGFLAHAKKFGTDFAAGKITAPAKTLDDMQRVIFNDYVDVTLASMFTFVVLAMVVFGIRSALAASKANQPTAMETPYVALAGAQHS
jgi:carbon starvation protein